MLATLGSLAPVEDYYRAIAPFHAAETRVRGDTAEWMALARRLAPRRVLDLGCGDGRIARALQDEALAREVVGVDVSTALLGEEPAPFTFVQADMRDIPLDEEFDLIVAADDPFAHLLDDDDRAAAVGEARRLLARNGLLVIDGLYVPPQQDALACAPDGLVRERSLDDRTTVREIWRAVGGQVYDVARTYEREGSAPVEARTRLRSWHSGERALRESGARIAGALDERDFDPWSDRLVAVVPGWS